LRPSGCLTFLRNAAQRCARGELSADDPTYHPYIKNFLKYQEELKARNACGSRRDDPGDIFSKEYLATLQKVGDEVFYCPASTGALKSL